MKSNLSRLPAYLTVQMVRFFYKEKESVNAKVLKDVKFPLMLDVYELCTKELQEKMVSVRSKFKEVEDKKLDKQPKKASIIPSCASLPTLCYYCHCHMSALSSKRGFVALL